MGVKGWFRVRVVRILFLWMLIESLIVSDSRDGSLGRRARATLARVCVLKRAPRRDDVGTAAQRAHGSCRCPNSGPAEYHADALYPLI